MKLKLIMTILIGGLIFSTTSQANDINISWDVRTLKAHAISESFKSLRFEKFLKKDPKAPKNTQVNVELQHKSKPLSKTI